MSDFMGFRFGPYHSNDLHLIATSSGNRFQKNLLPSPTDYTLDIPGGDGKFYAGQTFQSREITINVSFTDMDELTFRKLAQIFSTDKLQDLVFDEQPYKTYRAKCKSAPSFKFVCFKDPHTQQRIYKGEGTLSFICYKPFAYCFNKYVVTAADYYKTTQPKEILNPMSINYNSYIHDVPPVLTDEIKLHYNRDHNMNSSWDGGYPTIEQVQWGELYYNDKDGNKKLITDVKHYWDNVPKWQVGAKLLTTPTLDYEQELIYMPQYSKTNYYNMETGLNKQNALIGSRILVYNPGDLPIDFTLYLNNLNNHLRSIEEPYRFRISRYNVQRLNLENAVDWVGLTAYNEAENKDYKYGKRYVGILDVNSINNTTAHVGVDIEPTMKYLGESQPNHFYFVEPIPKNQLVRYLKMFIYQTRIKLKDNVNLIDGADASDQQQYEYLYNKIKNYEVAAEQEFHDYELAYEKCTTEEEQNELYWRLLLSILNGIFNCFIKNQTNTKFYIFDKEEDVTAWIEGFIFNPLEFLTINADSYSDYSNLDFNVYNQLNYQTQDYIEIESNFTDEELGQINLIFDSERRLLYNEVENEEQFEKITKKIIYNDHIKKGNWFQLPPGWSLIEVTPVILSGAFKGKRWLEARPFTWGGMDETDQTIFNRCEQLAIVDYISTYSPISNLTRDYGEDGFNYLHEHGSEMTRQEIHEYLTSQKTYPNYQKKLESYIQFSGWYIDNPGYQLYSEGKITVGRGFWESQISRTELEFLKLLNTYWRLAHLDQNGFPTSDAEDWWWYASSYIWSNFPPSYWGYIDILNNAKIEYIPQYY